MGLFDIDLGELYHKILRKHFNVTSLQCEMILTTTLLLVLACSFFMFPALFVSSVVFLAVVGQQLGVRRLYVSLLLQLFEFGRVNIESSERSKHYASYYEVEENESTSETVDSTTTTSTETRKDEINDDAKSPKADFINGFNNNGMNVIKRDTVLLPARIKRQASRHLPGDDDFINESGIERCLNYLKSGMESIIEDEVTSRFEAEELKNWNFLTRTNRRYEFISWKLTILWFIGCIVRYLILFPLRMIIFLTGVLWTVIAFMLISCLPNGSFKRWLNDLAFKTTFRIFARALSSVLTFHNIEYRPKRGGFCVANHTTPIDVVMLSTETCFSLIGQKHGGFFGLIQQSLAAASPHIWFERAEQKDRNAVASRLRQHVANPKNPSILIFPEGTCINNTSVMQFKKGTFEVDGTIYPVAMKYDPKFGDAFWNSSKYSLLMYIFMMMSSWAIVCDIWYMPPMCREDGESAIAFANRVKHAIAEQGGLVDLEWDGQLKRGKPKKELKEKQQEIFSQRLKNL
ncbi:glycerol-3-phosphate acyltransferase 3-like [Ctenocephalides felis]|uniref:glycerol-3-phosphate acyltransferase 3-like n=1 Tax=Ctenocephalides felis TaxID=7515 RepID=UPI000E6E5BAE|nr:glycerol-3-phosphate acyltransferase 3-like [Ctenocephalides felis]